METKRCCAKEGCYKDAMAPYRFCYAHAQEHKSQVRRAMSAFAQNYVDRDDVEAAAPLVEKAYDGERAARVSSLEWREQPEHGRYIGHSIHDSESRAVVESMKGGLSWKGLFHAAVFLLLVWSVWNLGAAVLSWQMPKGFYLALGGCIGFLVSSLLDLFVSHRFCRTLEALIGELEARRPPRLEARRPPRLEARRKGG